MLFQTLDDKRECPAVYSDGQFFYDQIPDGVTRSWKYTSYLKEYEVEYASLYCGGKSLGEACPEELQPQWEMIRDKLEAFHISFQEVGLNLNQHCFFDLVPRSFLREFCEVKNNITEYVFDSYEKPKNYDFLVSLAKVLADVAEQPLNINRDFIENNMANMRIRKLKRKLEGPNHINYNLFGTKTGRLTTTRSSFPILTLDKNFRSILKPNQDIFVELDFNAAEMRTFLALADQEQPQIDIHQWIGKNIFGGVADRDKIKRSVFAWLYNPDAKNKYLDKMFNKSMVKSKFYQNNFINNTFGRKIECDDYHSLNYLIQSTTSDLLLRRMIEVDKLLKGRKSNVAFTIHDSLVLDFSSEDKDLLSQIIQTFSNTDLGWFKSNVSAGKDFGNMRSLNL